METVIFSGMGNSQAVGEALMGLLADAGTEADMLWVFPVYAWGVPPVLVRYIEGLDLTGRVCHMVCTFGDEAGRTDRQWRRLIAGRGGTPGGVYGVRMPNTYVCLPFFDVDSPRVRQAKLDAAGERIEAIARAIASGSRATDLYYAGPLPGLKSRLIYPWFFRNQMKMGRFHHTVGCTGCGVCASACPSGNITRDVDGAPQWGSDCAFCLRCYHICPQHAVAYGRQTSGKGQYLHPKFRPSRFPGGDDDGQK